MKLIKIQRDKVVHVRFTDEQYKILQDMSIKFGNGKVSTCCYQVILAVLESKDVKDGI